MGGARLAVRKEEPFGNGNNPLLSLRVSNMERTVAELKHRGVEFLDDGEVTTDFYGKLIYFKDPDGNVINLFEPVQ